jgi:hypothetical protein
MAEQYRVILLGGSESVAPADIRASIARLFRLPEEKVERLFCRAPLVVKDGVGREAAEKIAQALESCGARARLEPVAEEAATPQAALRSGRIMTCPACGQNQPEAETCLFCGKVVAKVQEAIRHLQTEEQPEERRSKPRVLPEMALRPMGVGEMLAESLAMIRERLLTFAGITVAVPAGLILACLAVFGLLLYGYVSSVGGFQAVVMAAMVAGPTKLPISPGPLLLLLLLAVSSVMFIALWSQAALTYAVSERHLGHEIGILSSYRFALGRMAALYWTGFTTLLIVGGVFCGLTVPALFLSPFGPLLALPAALAGLYFALRYALIEKVVILEGLTGGEARARSRELVSGNLLRLILIGIVFGLVAWLVSLVAGLASVLFVALPLPLAVAGQLAVAVPLAAFTTAFPAMGLCLFYYDARLRCDGSLSLEELARNL